MAKKWMKTSYPGVRCREHPTRKHGVKPDKYFAIYYRVDGKRREEGLGWASEGWTAKKASVQLAKLKEAHLTGKGPQSLAEQRQQEKARREEEKLRQEREEREAVTFETFFNETYFPQAKANKSKRSYSREHDLFRLWISPVIGKKPLKKISPLDLERIKKNMADAGKAPRSIHYCLATIRQIFNLARMLGLYEGDNPVSKVKKPSVDNRRIRFLSHDEAETLLADLAKRSPQLHDMALLSLHCGLRAGEIFNLTWDCVDFDRETILLKDPKSKKNRTSYMTNRVKTMLQQRFKQCSEGYVFTDRNGNKIQEISNAFNRAINDLGFNQGVTDPRNRVVFHTLRHTYASWLVENGVNLYTVKELMGHSTLAMTERYSHLGPNTLKDAVRELDKSMERKNGEKVVNINK